LRGGSLRRCNTFRELRRGGVRGLAIELPTEGLAVQARGEKRGAGRWFFSFEKEKSKKGTTPKKMSGADTSASEQKEDGVHCARDAGEKKQQSMMRKERDEERKSEGERNWEQSKSLRETEVTILL